MTADQMTTPTPDPMIESGQADYWGTDQTTEFVFPDQISKMTIKVMNEGARSKFQRENNQDMKLNRRDDTASIRVDPAKERHSLITTSVTGWNLKKKVNGELQVVDFNRAVLAQWLEVADPKIVDDLEQACRLANPWLVAELSIEEIDKEIQRLHEMRDVKVAEDAGKDSSSSN